MKKTNPLFVVSGIISYPKQHLFNRSSLILIMSVLFMIGFNHIVYSQALPQTYTASGTWTCPAGVTVVQVETWGGGGSGGGSSANQQAGGGGGGGGYNKAFVNVVPGNVYNVTVGLGGVPDVAFGLGTAGGSSSFNGTVIATGGAPGQPNTAGGTGGAGGTGTFSGGLGATGINGGGPGLGGGGGGGAGTSANGSAGTTPTGGAGGTGNPGGAGGDGGINAGSNGNPGNVIGGGGGGGFRALTTSRTGGNGARGEVRLTTAPPIAPTYTSCPSNMVVNTNPGLCTASPTYSTTTFGNPLPTESYVLSGATTGSGAGTASGLAFNKGITTVTLTASNGTLPNATCVFTITVNDNQAPVLTNPGNQILSTAAGLCTQTFNILDPISDNCTGATWGYTLSGATILGPVSGITDGTNSGALTFNKGVTTVTLSGTDGTNPASGISFTVTVNDNQNPTISCPATQTINLNASCAGILPSYTGLASASDNCAGVVITQSPIAGTAISGTGSMTITLTATDASSNTSQCTLTVNKIDNTAPTISCPSTQTFILNGSCGGSLPNYTGLATSSDNCGSVTVTQSPVPGTAISGAGSLTITLTATDASSNTSQCTFTVNKIDNTAPTISCPSTQTFNLNGSCGGSLPNYTGLATTSDNCGGVTVTQSPVPGTAISGTGSLTITLTATDASSNSSQCTFTVNKIDNTAPTISCPSTQTFNLNGSCGGSLPNYTGLATASDNCGGVTVTQSPAPGTAISGVGSLTVTLTATDASANSTQCTFTVNKVDNTLPTAACQNIILPLDAFGNASIVPSDINNGSSDNCGTVSLSFMPGDQTSYDCFDVGNPPVTVTLIVNDGHGNSSTCTATVTADDVTPPVADITPLPNATGECGVTVTAPTATDVCAGTITGTTTDPTTYNTQGTFNITWTYNDGNGNTSTQTQTVVVDDVTSPTLTCDSIAVHPTFGTPVTVLPGMVTLTAGDNCSIVDTTVTPNFFDCSMDGNIVQVIVELTDIGGNITQCTTDVYVQGVACIPNQPPVAFCVPGFTVSADASCQYAATVNEFDAGSSDPDGDALTLTIIPSGPFGLGTTGVTLMVDDGNGGSSTCSTTITVNDVTAPVPDNLVASTISFGTGPVSLDPGFNPYAINVSGLPATITPGMLLSACLDINYPTVEDLDLFIGDPTSSVFLELVPASQLSGTNFTNTCFDIFSTDNPTGFLAPYTGAFNDDWTGTGGLPLFDGLDPNGSWPIYLLNNGFSSGTVNNISLTFVSTGASLTTLNGTCSVTISSPETATDNCGGPINGTASIAGAPQTIPFTITTQGTTVIDWTFTDGVNSTMVQQNVIIDDVTAPVADVDPLPNATGECSVTVAAPTATDVCAGTITGTTTDPTVYNTQGTFGITWTYDDGNGNTFTQTQTVIVDDVTPPVLSGVPANVSVSCTAVPAAASPTATDNCTAVTISLNETTTAGSCAGNYIITRTWTAADGNGNSSTGTQVITVIDNIAPVLSGVPANTTVDCSGVPAAASPTATDNCSGATVTFSETTAAGSCAGNYTITRTWTATDGCGNASTGTQIITVTDNIAPVLSGIPSNVTVDCASIPAAASPSATDNCNTVTITLNESTLPGSCAGNYTLVRTWTATDACGNSSTGTQNITVQDLTAPVISALPAPSTISCPSSPGFTIPTATDNCSGATLTFNDVTTPSCGASYSITRTWTATDGCGNSSVASQTINVVDNTPPVINCGPPIIVVGCAPATYNATPPPASDACGGPITFTNNHPGTSYPAGNTTIIWTATDACGNSSTCSQVITVTSAEADMYGNGYAINNASSIISLTNGTDFGNVNVTGATVTRTYTLKNSGGGTLFLTGTPKVLVSGVSAGDFSVIQPLVNSLAPGASTTFQVIFDPSLTGYRNARLTVLNNDCNESSYYFAIRGNGITGSPALVPDPSGTSQTNENTNSGENEGSGSSTTGVDENTVFSGNIYPNPGDGVFNLELSRMPGDNTQFRLLNGLGQVIYSSRLMVQTSYYDFSYLTAGTYYVQVISSEGNFTKPVIFTHKY